MIQARKIIGILAIIAFVGGVLFIALKNEVSENTNQNIVSDTKNNTSVNSDTAKNTNTGSSSNTSNATVKSYTLSDVAKHTSVSSCFTIVNNNVYDVTNWINKHPGGEEAILLMCGKDSSSYFNDQHGGERKPENILASFKIGVFKK